MSILSHQHTVWTFLSTKIKAGIRVALLIVIDSQGSSPGRQGFKMAVCENGTMKGSIGGGIMEHKLVEKAKDMLKTGEEDFLVKKQIHDAESAADRSGMICSGEQTVAICPISRDLEWVILKITAELKAGNNGLLVLGHNSIKFETGGSIDPAFVVRRSDLPSWSYKGVLSVFDTVHIIGGGHVGLALSRQMALLGFYVKNYDNRPALNTMADNSYAHEKIVTDYQSIGNIISGGPAEYVVIMTFGYRDDKEVLKQLIKKPFKYLGMMGSEAKVKQLFAELEAEGIEPKLISRVKAPVGISIQSKTPAEIAVSIAAEVVAEKNKP